MGAAGIVLIVAGVIALGAIALWLGRLSSARADHRSAKRALDAARRDGKAAEVVIAEQREADRAMTVRRLSRWLPGRGTGTDRAAPR